MNIPKVAKQTGGADKEANVLRQKILNSVNGIYGGGTVYYFSESGDDLNDGLSPQTPLKSYLHIADLPLKAGDSVLFERGSLFRTSNRIEVANGVYYGAYGTGEKPRIYGSLRDYADPTIWNKSSCDYIWETPLKTNEIAGMINFNNDECIGVWKPAKDDLKIDGDFYHDNEKGIFYLYLQDGNPGEVFDNIEIATTMMFMYAARPEWAENITIENLCMKYATFGPVDICLPLNVRVSNCEIGWHGGRVFSRSNGVIVRYGNAIEFWYRASDVVVESCWIYQIFDAAITFQGQYNKQQARFNNIRFQNNLIEYCSMNLEYWAGTPEDEKTPYISNISFNNNIIRFGGYGWGGIQRPDKDGQGMLLGWNYSYDDMHDFVMSENILDCADCHMIYLKLPKEQDGLMATNNTYYQKKTSGLHNCVQVVRGVDILAENQQDFEKAILEFDSNPKKVKWLSD